MTKFKEGDSVVCVEENSYVAVGTRGVVKENGICPYVSWDNGENYALLEDRMAHESHVTQHKPQYAPGQRLTSAEEVMQALIGGQKIQRKGDWCDNSYVQLQGDEIVDQSGNSYPIKYFRNFHIYTPPKRKVKSERWIAVSQDKGWMGGIFWESFHSEADARRACPNALAYVRAETEAEIDNND